jgi:hypothetical protein
MRTTVASERACKELKDLALSSAMPCNSNVPSAVVNQALKLALWCGWDVVVLILHAVCSKTRSPYVEEENDLKGTVA